jgi:hypothetical protein
MNIKAVHLVLLLPALVACQTVEQTGRSQFVVVSESQESQLGEDAYREILKNKNSLPDKIGKHS